MLQLNIQIGEAGLRIRHTEGARVLVWPPFMSDPQLQAFLGPILRDPLISTAGAKGWVSPTDWKLGPPGPVGKTMMEGFACFLHTTHKGWMTAF